MADTVIEIPGVGVVSFPDSMDSAQINHAAAKLYQDSQKAAPASPTPAPESMTDAVVRNAKDLASGVGAGIANTVFGGGDLIRRATGMPRIKDEPDVKAMTTPPDSTAGKAGYYGEQVGEFFLPTGIVGKAGKLAEVAKSGALTLAQSGSPVDAGVSAGLTAVLPGGSAAKRMSGALSEGAEKTVAQALGATKEWAKSEAGKLAPQILERGISGSRQGMLAQARAAVAEVGPKLTQAYKDAAAAGATVNGDVIRGNLQFAAEKLMVKDSAGQRVAIAGTEPVVNKLRQLEDFVETLGTDIPVDKAAFIKTTWDQIVSKAGLFGHKATSSATDNANAWAVREGAGAFRELLNANPTIEALNKEFGFWKGLRNVLSETEKRTQAQGGGLSAAITGSAGMAAGFASGDSVGDRLEKAFIGGAAGRQVVKLVQSPYWRTTVSAPLKDLLAKSLASGNASQIESVSKVLIRSLPAQLRDAFTP